MAKKMVKKFTQPEFDVIKWLDSEKAGKDMCGEYIFCKSCTKIGDTPCYDARKEMYRKIALKRKATIAKKKALAKK